MGPYIDFSPHQNHAHGYLHGTRCRKLIILHTQLPYLHINIMNEKTFMLSES